MQNAKQRRENTLRGSLVEFNPTTEADLDYVMRAESLPDSTPYVFSWTRERHAAATIDPDIEHFIIRPLAHPAPVGYCFLEGLSDPWKIIEITRIVITEKGKGYGRDAMETLIRHAFGDLDAERFWLDVADYNERAMALYESLGFKYEGTLRHAARMEGKVADMRVYSIVRGDPLPIPRTLSI